MRLVKELAFFRFLFVFIEGQLYCNETLRTNMKEEKNPRPTPRGATVEERILRSALRGMQRKNDVYYTIIKRE